LAQVFVEKVNSELKYINESSNVSGKTYIGKLAGIAADFTKPTRNGRRYPLELWQNVEKSDEFKEMMATMTCFGEADHPSDESGRVDTSIKEIAVVLTKYEIQKDKGVVYCEFLILDTPNGRIIKTLLDAGCKMGVSSRGIGDEVIRNGETIIDPETYQFYGFDVVVMPAVVSARPAVVESRNRNKNSVSLTKSIRKEIFNSNTEGELNSISNMITALNLPDSASLKEALNIRRSEIKSGNNISQGSDNKYFKENQKLKADLGKLRLERKSMQAKLDANNIRLNALNSDTPKLKKVCESLRNEIVSMQIAMSNLESNYKNVVAENKLLNSKVSKLTESANRSKKVKLEESKRNTLVEKKLQETNTKLANSLSKYLQVVCTQASLDEKSVRQLLPKNGYDISDIDKIVNELSDRKRRFDKLPFEVQPRTAKLLESSYMTDEDKQTIMFLSGNGQIN